MGSREVCKMKPDELFNRIPVVVKNGKGELEEKELREKYHEDVIVAYKSFKGSSLSPVYKGLVITKSFEIYRLTGTDEIVSHIKADIIDDRNLHKFVTEGFWENWIIIDKERFKKYKNENPK